MESERANKDEVVPAMPDAAAVPSRAKRPDKAPSVAKKRQDAAKDTEGETKPKPRPRYTDKSWKNKKNKKSGQENKTEAEAEAVAEDDAEDDAKAEPSPDAQEEPPNGHPAVTEPADAHVSDDVTTTTETPPVDSDKEEDSWDTLFNDDGDCLDSHLLEEVSTSGFDDFHDGDESVSFRFISLFIFIALNFHRAN